MLMVDIIRKKRDGGHLTREEIYYFINGYVKGEIPDYQISALLMAIFFNKMDEKETLWLTEAMYESGDTLNLSAIHGVKVDKHSTGGVGDKTTLVLAPMVASIGVPVAKMSGRGLGFTGGTIDKLESIKGFSTDISNEAFIDNVNSLHLAVKGQTADLAPADKLLYALRDVTATVDNMSLIASSIMSKKLAAGADAIVLDVTVGSGAFMKDIDSARLLAREMVKLGNNAGRKTMAVISNMDEPLGHAVGNSLEMIEAIECLKGKGPSDLMEISLTLGSYMSVFAGAAENITEARKKLSEQIANGNALTKFAEFIKLQGGDPAYVFDTGLFAKAGLTFDLKLDDPMYVSRIDCEEVGMSSVLLGAGRLSKTDPIDHSVGIVIHSKVGDLVGKGESYATLYANDEAKLKSAAERLQKAFEFSKVPVPKQTLIKEIIE